MSKPVVFGMDFSGGGAVSFFRSNRRPLKVSDLAELLSKYEWAKQLNVLDYMRRFATWDQLYDDLERRHHEAAVSQMRNVTPDKPKQLRETNE